MVMDEIVLIKVTNMINRSSTKLKRGCGNLRYPSNDKLNIFEGSDNMKIKLIKFLGGINIYNAYNRISGEIKEIYV